ncbi:hypothetical protein [Planctomicrobium sp. SH527]|uniref:hypothetical protein n=1 Tax=Planctomicrobium sp. SH527 TaxID=3448123 RepID=UPI003F5CA2A9
MTGAESPAVSRKRQLLKNLGFALCLPAFFAGVAPAIASPLTVASADSATEGASVDPLMKIVDEAIEVTRMRNLDFQQHTPWQILHGLLALRENYTIKNGNEFVNALDFLSTKARYKGEGWFEKTQHGGRAHPYNGTPYDFEGHVNQTMAIIAMCNVPLTHKFHTANGQVVTMQEMVQHAQYALNPKDELTWTLWFLTHYVDQDASWTTSSGQRWNMEALVRNQNAAAINNSPCGGCHNLFAVAYARNAYMQKHGQLRGAWLEADQRLQQYISAAQSMQNRDGSFATQFFRARGHSTQFNERIKASGHMLEWLLVALPKKRLNEQWMRNGIYSLATDLITNASQPADCGPLYHSLHALVLYKQRMQGANAANAQEQTVAKPQTKSDAASEQQVNVLATPAATTGQEFQTPVQTTPKARLPVPGPINPAPQSTPPALLSPPTNPNEGDRLTPRQERLERLQDRQRRLRKSSASTDDTSEIESVSGEKTLEKIPLSPVPGGMPIFKPTAYEMVSIDIEPELTPAEVDELPAPKQPEQTPPPVLKPVEPAPAMAPAPVSREPVKAEPKGTLPTEAEAPKAAEEAAASAPEEPEYD